MTVSFGDHFGMSSNVYSGLLSEGISGLSSLLLFDCNMCVFINFVFANVFVRALARVLQVDLEGLQLYEAICMPTVPEVGIPAATLSHQAEDRT